MKKDWSKAIVYMGIAFLQSFLTSAFFSVAIKALDWRVALYCVLNAILSSLVAMKALQSNGYKPE